ncbi:MAG: TolB-like protein [Bacteriovoracaceae bacterium]|jgi:TolB-like protein
MKNYFVLVLTGIIGVSCASFKAERVDNKTSDAKSMEITDNWMSEDTKQTVKTLITQMQGHRGYKRMMDKFKGTPKVFIAEVQNNTSEAYFPIDDMNDEFLFEISAAGDFQLVDAKAREKILSEITYQNDGMVDPAQAKQIGKQLGADFMIFGNVRMKPEKRDGKTLKEYSVNLRMTNVETAGEVFRLRKRVNKYSDKKSYGW